MSGMHYGGSNVKSSKTKYAILDSGTSLIAVSLTDWEKIKEKIMDKLGQEALCSPA